MPRATAASSFFPEGARPNWPIMKGYLWKSIPAGGRGSVKVTVKDIKNFDSTAGLFDKVDPFVEMKLGKLRHRTSVKNNAGGNATFDEEFRFPLSLERGEKEQILRITVFDQDTTFNDTLGTNEIDLQKTVNGIRTLDMVQNGKVQGQVRLIVHRNERDEDWKRFFVSATCEVVTWRVDEGEQVVDSIKIDELVGIVSYNDDDDGAIDSPLRASTSNSPLRPNLARQASLYVSQQNSLGSKAQEHRVEGLGRPVDEFERKALTCASSVNSNRSLANSQPSLHRRGSVGARNNMFWRPGANLPELQTIKKKAYASQLGADEFCLVTSPFGPYRGQVYKFKADNADVMDRWTQTMGKAIAAIARRDRKLRRATLLEMARVRLRSFYLSDHFQMAVAVMIMSNFVINVAEGQVPQDPHLIEVFEEIDNAFTALFTIELCVNLLATLVSEFVSDAWNWFDVVVVLISLLSLAMPHLPGADILKLVRCFRVLRLCKRVLSFRNIIIGLAHSLLPMLNALCLVVIVTALYAIVGVIFFSEMMPEAYGSFFVSFFSLFQSMTLDEWSDQCRLLMKAAQPAAQFTEEHVRIFRGDGWWVGLFYVSYIILVGIVLVNVMIAIVVGSFADAVAHAQQLDKRTSEEIEADDDFDFQKQLVVSVPLHRICRDLHKCTVASELREQVAAIFGQIAEAGLAGDQVAVDPFLAAAERADLDATRKSVVLLKKTLRFWRHGSTDFWTLSPDEFCAGLRGLDYLPPISIGRQTFNKYIKAPGFTEANGSVSLHQFARLVCDQMSRDLMHHLVHCEQHCEANDSRWDSAVILAAGQALGALVRLSDDRSGLNASLGLPRRHPQHKDAEKGNAMLQSHGGNGPGEAAFTAASTKHDIAERLQMQMTDLQTRALRLAKEVRWQRLLQRSRQKLEVQLLGGGVKGARAEEIAMERASHYQALRAAEGTVSALRDSIRKQSQSRSAVEPWRDGGHVRSRIQALTRKLHQVEGRAAAASLALAQSDHDRQVAAENASLMSPRSDLGVAGDITHHDVGRGWLFAASRKLRRVRSAPALSYACSPRSWAHGACLLMERQQRRDSENLQLLVKARPQHASLLLEGISPVAAQEHDVQLLHEQASDEATNCWGITPYHLLDRTDFVDEAGEAALLHTTVPGGEAGTGDSGLEALMNEERERWRHWRESQEITMKELKDARGKETERKSSEKKQKSKIEIQARAGELEQTHASAGQRLSEQAMERMMRAEAAERQRDRTEMQEAQEILRRQLGEAEAREKKRERERDVLLEELCRLKDKDRATEAKREAEKSKQAENAAKQGQIVDAEPVQTTRELNMHAQESALPSGWIRGFSRTRRSDYYLHTSTGLCSWTPPTDNVVRQAAKLEETMKLSRPGQENSEDILLDSEYPSMTACP